MLHGEHCCDCARLFFSAIHFSVITYLKFILGKLFPQMDFRPRSGRKSRARVIRFAANTR